MIFVTIGTMPFPRLIKGMDEIAGRISETVVMQTGYTKYSCKNAEYYEFLDYKTMVEFIMKARIVVCHDGAGSVICALQFGKPVIAIPRLKKYGELFYDNQGEFAGMLVKEKRIKLVDNIDDLERLLGDCCLNEAFIACEKGKGIIGALKEFISRIETKD